MNTKLLVNGKLRQRQGRGAQACSIPPRARSSRRWPRPREEQITAAVKAAAKAFRRLGGHGAEGSRRRCC